MLLDAIHAVYCLLLKIVKEMMLSPGRVDRGLTTGWSYDVAAANISLAFIVDVRWVLFIYFIVILIVVFPIPAILAANVV